MKKALLLLGSLVALEAIAMETQDTKVISNPKVFRHSIKVSKIHEQFIKKLEITLANPPDKNFKDNIDQILKTFEYNSDKEEEKIIADLWQSLQNILSWLANPNIKKC